jgi:hypothetical protein
MDTKCWILTLETKIQVIKNLNLTPQPWYRKSFIRIIRKQGHWVYIYFCIFSKWRVFWCYWTDYFQLNSRYVTIPIAISSKIYMVDWDYHAFYLNFLVEPWLNECRGWKFIGMEFPVEHHYLKSEFLAGFSKEGHRHRWQRQPNLVGVPVKARFPDSRPQIPKTKPYY